MKEEEKKKGLFAFIKESMTKTGGCCGAGSSCCGPSAEKSAPEKSKKTEPSKGKKRESGK